MSKLIFTAASKDPTDPSGSHPRFEGAFWGNGGSERIHAEAGALFDKRRAPLMAA